LRSIAMTVALPTYDLVLILDPEAAEDTRAKIVADSRGAIEAGGELTRHDEWGERPLAYPIAHRTSGEYHLLQFHAGGSDLLSGLDRSLKIADEVLRFRIIKLRPGVPDAPDMRQPASHPRRAEGEQPAPDSAAPAQAEEAGSAAEADAAEADAPEAGTPETDAPETDAPETDAPETDAPEAGAPETDAPEAGVGEPA
jgi:small subunit ribosomal protein S6